MTKCVIFYGILLYLLIIKHELTTAPPPPPSNIPTREGRLSLPIQGRRKVWKSGGASSN